MKSMQEKESIMGVMGKYKNLFLGSQSGIIRQDSDR